MLITLANRGYLVFLYRRLCVCLFMIFMMVLDDEMKENENELWYAMVCLIEFTCCYFTNANLILLLLPPPLLLMYISPMCLMHTSINYHYIPDHKVKHTVRSKSIVNLTFRY